MPADVCSSCGRVLLWSGGRLVCANVHCTAGHDPESRRRDRDDHAADVSASTSPTLRPGHHPLTAERCGCREPIAGADEDGDAICAICGRAAA